MSERYDCAFLGATTAVAPLPDNRTGAPLYTFKYVRVQDSYFQLAYADVGQLELDTYNYKALGNMRYLDISCSDVAAVNT